MATATSGLKDKSDCVEQPTSKQFQKPEFTHDQASVLQEIAEARAKNEPEPVSERFWVAAEFCAWLTEEASGVKKRLNCSEAHPNSAPESPRRHLPWGAWIVGLAILVVAFQATFTDRQAWAAGEAPALRTEDASQTVTDFYRAINGGAYAAAYQRLSTTWRKELSQERFESGLTQAQRLRWQFLNVQASEDGRARVDVIVSVDGGRKIMEGYYDLVVENGSWKLDKAAIWERRR